MTTSRDPVAGRPWWQRRWCLVLLALLGAVPLLWPAIPPLTDLPGHIGSFRIMIEAGQGALAQHYRVVWSLIGNLGVDALVLSLAPLLDLEPATKLIVMAIPVLTGAAMLWLSREAHGKCQPSVLFALPLAYAAPFQFGFVNFSLAVALTIAGLALWMRLARGSPAWVPPLLFVPIAGLVWLCHSFGWALLGLFIAGGEWALQRGKGRSLWSAGVRVAAKCAPLVLPVILFMAAGARSSVGGTGDWFDLRLKLLWALSVLRERWQLYDILTAGALFFLAAAAWRARRLSFAPVLAAPALCGAVAFVLLPAFLAGASYVDMRVLPATLALALIALRVEPGNAALAKRLALAGLAFFTIRLVTSTVAMALFAQGQMEASRAIEAMPPGAAVLVLVNEPAADNWNNPRLGHIAGLATARRRVFTNEQWTLPGQQLVRSRHPGAAPFEGDPSQLVYPKTVSGGTDFDRAITTFDRRTFGFVWTIGFPAGRAHQPDLAPIWHDDHSALYRVTHMSPQITSR
jgi:hypothetical protein